jgi:ubiquinone/menaquinone biosynthesis C-methylase UbiE
MMDFHELKFNNAEFDAVYMREALEHSIAPFIALCEVNRVLKTEGIFLVNVPSQDWVDWHCHYIVPTEKQLKALLDKTNFKVEKQGITAGGHLYFLCKKIGDINL